MKIDLKSRRMFLQGMGGSFLAIPFLTSLAPRRVWAQSVAVRPKFVNYICREHRRLSRFQPTTFVPTSELGAGVNATKLADVIARDGRIAQGLSAGFNAYASKINIMGDLTCHSSDNLHKKPYSTANSSANGPTWSIDSKIEKYLYGANTPSIPVLRISLYNKKKSSSETLQHTMSYDGGSGSIHDDVQQTLEALRSYLGITFNNLSGTTSSEAEIRAAQRADFFNAVYEDYQRIMNDPRISAQDNLLMQSTMDTVNDIRTRELASSTNAGSCSMPAEITRASNEMGKAHLHGMDILVAALACGATDIACYTMCLGHDDYNHIQNDGVLVHTIQHGGSREKYGFNIDDLTDWRNEKLLYFINKMDSTPGVSGGSLLDETMIHYTTEYGSANHSRQGFSPITIGDAGGRFKTGYYIDGEGKPISAALITMMKGFGLSTAQIEGDGVGVGFGEYERVTLTNTQKRESFPLLKV